eukprot:1641695-Pleurochrysis_carterae.AAC.6
MNAALFIAVSCADGLSVYPSNAFVSTALSSRLLSASCEALVHSRACTSRSQSTRLSFARRRGTSDDDGATADAGHGVLRARNGSSVADRRVI